MGHGHDHPGVLLEVRLEPIDAVGVEVVGRLVEQQDIGTLEQDLAERHPPPFAAGEGGDVGVAGGQSHGVHGDFEPAVELPAFGGVDAVLDVGLLVEQGVHLVGVGAFGHPGVDRVEPMEQGADLGDGLLDVAEHVLLGVEHRLLRQVADRGPGGWPRDAVELGLLAGHDPQERALAGPVAPQDADLGPRIEREREVLQDLFLAVRLRQALDRIDVLRRHRQFRKVLGVMGNARETDGDAARSATHPRAITRGPTRCFD